jgi:hypothetical protein
VLAAARAYYAENDLPLPDIEFIGLLILFQLSLVIFL